MSVPVARHTSLANAMHCLLVDQVTAEVVGALGAAGIESILLKGPSIASWLYPDGGRSYMDTDLLVPPSSYLPAQAVLQNLGFADACKGFSPRERNRVATIYWRSALGDRRQIVDLHQCLVAVQASPQQLWETLSSQTVEMLLAGRRIRVLGPIALAMHIALHAAQHGAYDGLSDDHPVEDLRRVIPVLDPAEWAASADLAHQLGAEDAFAMGLRLLPEGVALTTAMGLSDVARPEVCLAARPHPRGSSSVLAVFEAPSTGERLLRLARVLFPTPSALRFANPRARRGNIGLALAYVSRFGRILVSAWPALAGWRRARQDSVGQPCA